MNLHQFLSRVQNYEQKKKYNLELKKFKQLKKETESLQEKPKLSHNTLRICKAMPKEPLYKRTNEVLKEHENELKNLTIYYTMPREVRERGEKNNNRNKDNKSKMCKTKYYSAENTRSSYVNEYDSLQTYNDNNTKNNNGLKHQKSLPKKITKQRSDQFFDRQEKWLKSKRDRNQYFEKFYQIHNDNYSNVTFRPCISQATLEILDIKNRINTNNDEVYKYNIPNSQNQYDNFILNKGRTIWDKLYEESFQKKRCLELQDVKDYNKNNNYLKKRNKFKNVTSKYLDLYKKDISKMGSKRNRNNSFDYKNNLKKLRANKSFDDNRKNMKRNICIDDSNSITPNLGKNKDNNNIYKRRSFYEFNDVNEYNYHKKKKEKEKFHWRNSLLKLKPNFTDPYDNTYHLNIMQTGAWNDNYLNKITLNENSKCRSVINLVIE
jgi:hypothetical protein